MAARSLRGSRRSLPAQHPPDHAVVAERVVERAADVRGDEREQGPRGPCDAHA